ncbi:hypothetical protein [Mucilaginibacter segetis]|uniref:Nucleotide-diphospho-sugar transferase n=1 Tax=Mucilaginibacter segetis TaxID=2793071 RepID=A0A934PTP2_9SPHI|nr:hypothetical protein [Mucilaginibacter segetis]MBK0380644.1 hypothetical protein [Mucilaginibacter segetis]
MSKCNGMGINAAESKDDLSTKQKLSDAELPIFFLQLGAKTSLFFDRILKQAVLSNGTENVFILTDTNFEQYSNFNCIDISGYANRERIFDKVYKHHSTNPYFFEKTCFDRWFIINELIKEHAIENFMYADCDVLILEDIKPVFNNFIKDYYDGTMMFFAEGENSITSAHTSFWNSKLLNSFCDFVIAKYTDEQQLSTIVTDAAAGKFFDNKNVSDMILLDVFRTETLPATLPLLSLEGIGMGFDFNINASFNGYKHYFACTAYTRIKKLIQRRDGLYGLVKDDVKSPASVKFYTLHFQGYLTKALIPVYGNYSKGVERFKNNITGYYNFLLRRGKLAKNAVKRSFRKF